MKKYWQILCIASLALAGCATHSAVRPGPSTGALSPQQVLANMRGAAHEAAIACSHFYDHSRHLQIRSSEMGRSLAAILRLRNAVRKYHDAVSSEEMPRPDWLRECSEHLLNAWVKVEVSFPQLEPTPPVVGWWNRSQDSLVAMYQASSPYIGQPSAHGPLPTALGIRASKTR
ncbi:MAG: hypothetical protein WA117_17185 [Verrucomicrobiia bacterium]